MRTVRYLGAGKGVTFDQRAAEPDLPPGEALLRPIRVGVTAEDVQIARGNLTTDPITLGHEFVAVVEAARDESGKADKALIGKRVVGSASTFCTTCDLCRAGLRDHCRARATLGVRGRDGCFADLFCLPTANLHTVPDAVDDDSALLASPLADALHASRMIRLDTKPFITILGEGPRALLCVQVMQRLNASVRLVTRSERCAELCDKWAIKCRMLDDVGRRADQDVVIDCTRSAEGFTTATRLVRPRGVIILKGALVESQSAIGPVDLGAIAAKELTIIGSRCGSLAETLPTLERHEYDVASLISRRMKLDDALAALDIATHPGQTKVVMDV